MAARSVGFLMRVLFSRRGNLNNDLADFRAVIGFRAPGFARGFLVVDGGGGVPVTSISINLPPPPAPPGMYFLFLKVTTCGVLAIAVLVIADFPVAAKDVSRAAFEAAATALALALALSVAGPDAACGGSCAAASSVERFWRVARGAFALNVRLRWPRLEEDCLRRRDGLGAMAAGSKGTANPNPLLNPPNPNSQTAAMQCSLTTMIP